MQLGEIAAAYLRRFADQASTTDKIFGIHDKDGRFYIGNTEVILDDNDIIIGNKTYTGTPGLWELIVSKQPSPDIYTVSDMENYQEILLNTNALKRNNDPNEVYPKSNKSVKWLNLLKPIWDKRARKRKGDGLHTIYLPSDSSALLQRLDILLASKQAGNTGVRNEAVAVCDELKRQGRINDDEYKLFNQIINK